MKTLNIVYLNARSLLNKINDLNVLINDKSPDIILITETWANESITNAMLNVPGYCIEPDLRIDRSDTLNGIGGGLIVYTRDGLIIKPVEVENEFNMFVRFQVVSGNKDDRDLQLTLVYRPPRINHNNNTELYKLFENCSDNDIFIGDFNFPKVNWADLTSDRASEPFLDCTIDNGFAQLVDFPTHLRGNVLDLILTNRPENILHIEPLGNLGNSDHSILAIDVLFNPRSNTSTELIYDWKNGNMEGLREFLGNEDWERSLLNKDAEQAWTLFKGKIDLGLAQFIPKIRRRSSNNHQWMSKTVKRLVRKKQRHYNVYMDTRTPQDYDRFKATEKECKRAIRKAKKKFETSIARNGNKRPFNSYIKSKTKSRVSVGPLKQGTELVTDNKQMASILNNQFSSVFTNEDLVNIPPCPDTSGGNTIEDLYFNSETVYKKIRSLKISSSSGPDGLSSKFLSDYADVLAAPLTIIFNKSMESGQVPEDWRVANVTPIYKNKGVKSKAENYRPISLTSIPCKLMESIIRDAVVDYLTRHNLIKNTQHGFMSRRSCTTNLLEFLEGCTRIYDNGDPIDIIYLDFAKAFDKVPHSRLLNKMRSLGITGNILRWTETWLRDRRQRTVLNGSLSDWLAVLSGVPQGSVLGPLLFVIFINDIDGCAEQIALLLKFADDTKVGNRAATIDERKNLQACLDKLTAWANKWCMSFNTDKCKVLHVGKSNPKQEYTMNGSPLAETVKERDIGVNITNDLKPSSHCAESARRANAILTQISRAFMYRDRKVFLQLYKQFVRCHLEFAVPAWSPWAVGDIEVIERVQKRAINMVSGLTGRTYEDKLSELGLTTLLERRVKLDMVQTYKIINRVDDVNAETWFKLTGISNRSTRSTSYHKNITLTTSRTETRKNFFSSRVAPTWNSLPTELKECKSVQLFKTKLNQINLIQDRPN